ncbi:glycosyltransferase family protein [Limnovirga soli]|uniref:Glycosyltransferase n=1 Tax=Limnovirga soli TaxID=2656915 RepID=A0A8J8JR09_9BACT|nr:glycosyltransferase [Limnovirga soli]NNV55352.1 hypothetical protein [Limnovirga soli]
MRIAVLHHGNDFSNDYAAYLSGLLDETAAANDFVVKDYHYLRLTKDPLPAASLLMHIVIPAESNFALTYWYNVKLPAIFKKYGIDKVISLFGICAATPIPQLLVLPDTGLLKPHKKMPVWQNYAAKKLGKSIATAKGCITYSNHAKETYGKVYAAAQNATVVPYTVNEIFTPKEWHDKLYIKSRFAENKEYFVALIPGSNVEQFTDILKAFSRFKKWQQSNMQLLLMPKEETFTRAIDDKLDSYKFREDVKLLYEPERKETAEIIATAYAMMHMATTDADLLPIAAAIQCGTPVIAYYTPSIQEYCGAAAKLIPEPGFEPLGDELIQVFKNETLKAAMCDAAVNRAANYTQNHIATALWHQLKS